MTELQLKEAWLLRDMYEITPASERSVVGVVSYMSLTRDESKTVSVESGVIHVIPLWRFLASQ